MLKTLFLLLAISILAPYTFSPPPIDMDIQLPPGEHHVSNASVFLPLPTKAVFWIVIESHIASRTQYRLVIEASCRIERISGPLNGTLRGFGDRALVYGILDIPRDGCEVVAKLYSSYAMVKMIRLRIFSQDLNARIASVYLPTTYLGDPDPRREPFTLVESNPSPLLRFLGAVPSHMLLGYMRVDVEGSRGAKLLLVGFIEDEHGSRAPIASTILEEGSGEAYIRSSIELNCSSELCRGYVVIPLWSLEPVVPPGRYRIVLELYVLGTARALDRYVHGLRIEMLGYGDIVVPLAVAGLGVALLPLCREIRDPRKVAYASLTAAAIMALSRFPGTIVFRLASILGPFDWVVYAPITTGIYYALLVVAARKTNSTGVPGIAVLIEWLLTVLILGSGNIVLSSIWALTTFSVVMVATALSKACGWRLAPMFFAMARAVDAYADINIYAYAYRLFYAPWYIATYSLGTALIAGIGSFIALKAVENHAES